MTFRIIPAATILATSLTAHAASTQIGDLRLSSTAYSGTSTYFDPASPGNLTRNVSGAPVNINSNFIAVSQNPGGTADSGTDIGLQTFSASTAIRQLNRYASSTDGGATGAARVGAVQWTIDLSPIGGYLSGNSLDLTALDLRLVTDPTGGTGPTADEVPYDIYLSYTRAAESISLAGISTTSAGDNYDNFWWPAQSTAEGNIANGTHMVVERGFLGNMDLTLDLLALYDSGVTDINLIMTSGGFFSGRTIGILDGSGISIDTVAIPEPSSMLLFGVLGSFALLRRRTTC